MKEPPGWGSFPPAVSPRTVFLVVVAAFTVLHVVLGVALPLSGDEAYYWDCSRHLDWSYFDQPPLVIWAMVPFRAVFGECRLAVRAPAILASLITGLCLLPLARRLGGGPREATLAYLWMHGMPLFFLGAFYASTDVVMTAAYVAATLAAVALAQGQVRAWWGFGVAVGLGFLAKFSIVLVLPALLPVLFRSEVRSQLLTPRPYLAAFTSCALTAPVWVWALQHDWDNILFQIAGRHDPVSFTLEYLVEFVAVNFLLATPFLAVATLFPWWKRWRAGGDAAWRVLLVAAVSPLVLFGVVALRTRVGAHWGGPGLVVAIVVLALTPFRGRRLLASAGMVSGLLLCGAVLLVVAFPERVLEVEWHYRGRPQHVSTSNLAALLGNDEIVAETRARLRPGELVASESYTTVHLLAFLSRGELPTRLAHVKPGKHGLASLYWHRPEELRGRDFLFVSEKFQVDEELRKVFAEVRVEEPLEIERDGRIVRTVRFLRCRDLRRSEGVFTRLPAADQ